MELKDCRRRIDEINSEMERLFLERMEISLDVAAYKQEHHLPTFDPARDGKSCAGAGESSGRTRALCFPPVPAADGDGTLLSEPLGSL